MSETIECFNEEIFVKDFIQKLENVLKKAPIQARAKIIKSRVEIITSGFKESIIFNFDYTQDVKTNMFNLKKILYEERYPTISIFSEEKEKYSTSEIENMIEDGVPLAEALSKQKIIKTETKYKINRVLIPKDQLFLKNTKNNEDEQLFQLKMPLSIFLKRMREKWSTEKTSEMFQKYAEFVRIIYPAEVWKKLNEDRQRVTIEELNE